MPNPVVHFEIQAKDPKKVQDFYQKLFDGSCSEHRVAPVGSGAPRRGSVNVPRSERSTT